jgi:hypothetical protein
MKNKSPWSFYLKMAIWTTYFGITIGTTAGQVIACNLRKFEIMEIIEFNDPRYEPYGKEEFDDTAM